MGRKLYSQAEVDTLLADVKEKFDQENIDLRMEIKDLKSSMYELEREMERVKDRCFPYHDPMED
jgi:cell division septum initiation protein DivIVA